jgi:hypothetical protein
LEKQIDAAYQRIGNAESQIQMLQLPKKW